MDKNFEYKLEVKSLQVGDLPALIKYFQQLSDQSKSSFGPHAFNSETLESICRGVYQDCFAFTGQIDTEIVAYGIVKPGFLDFDLQRMNQYAISHNNVDTFTLAPSVLDAYQSKGIGSTMLQYIEQKLIGRGAEQIVLWGGVQERNQAAIAYYLKNGFRVLGRFHHQGWNLDMAKTLF